MRRYKSKSVVRLNKQKKEKEIRYKKQEAVPKVKILADRVIPNLFRDLTYNALES